MAKLSIVVPVYFNEMNLEDLYEDLHTKVLVHLDSYELVFIDDGSTDRSFEIIKEFSIKDENVKYLKLSRNFGSHAAILAGLTYSTGDCAVVKTADLQEPSEILIEMFEKWKNGNNVVLAIRKDRDEPLIQKIFSNLYYKIMKNYVLKNMPEGGFDCFLVDRKVIEVLDLMDEKNTSIVGQILWVGFKSDSIYYVRQKREKGKSKWTLSKKIKLFIDSFLGFSYLPIRFISIFGFLFFILSILWAIYIIINKIFGGISIEGWTTLMVFNLFSSGIILLTLGILGEYIWRAFDASRNRPSYIVEDENFSKKI